MRSMTSRRLDKISLGLMDERAPSGKVRRMGGASPSAWQAQRSSCSRTMGSSSGVHSAGAPQIRLHPVRRSTLERGCHVLPAALVCPPPGKSHHRDERRWLKRFSCSQVANPVFVSSTYFFGGSFLALKNGPLPI
jgi:hypothetical protein